VKIGEEEARVIVKMADVCHSEGIGPDFDDLLKRIAAWFPEIKKDRDFAHLMKEALK
jgi:hypothetical protein